VLFLAVDLPRFQYFVIGDQKEDMGIESESIFVIGVWKYRKVYRTSSLVAVAHGPGQCLCGYGDTYLSGKCLGPRQERGAKWRKLHTRTENGNNFVSMMLYE